MIVSVISPHARRNGNTVSSMLLSLGLGELKRKVLLTHVQPQSSAFEHYLGLKAYEDKTSTPTQLVKLMREGAIKPEEIGDYCKVLNDYVDVFTNNATNFSEKDMSTLLSFIMDSSVNYEYVVIDVDESLKHETTKKVIENSDIVILNVSPSFLELEEFKAMQEQIKKLTAKKKVLLLTSMYDTKACKLKEIPKVIGVKTSSYMIRENSWIKYGCNYGKLNYVFEQSKAKDSDVIEISRDVSALTSAISKAKVAIAKQKKGKGGMN